MAIKGYANSQATESAELLTEKLAREERNYRADRLVEKWSKVPEIGKGIKNMNVNTARNLAIMLENQTRTMSKMNEAQLSNNFYGYTPENMLRLVRLSYPNSVRGDIFTEFAMESSHDSIKYIEPRYTNAQRNDFDWDLQEEPGKWNMDNRFDDPAHNRDIMYESTESRYATELVNVADENINAEKGLATGILEVAFKGGALNGAYIPNASVLYLVVDGERKACAMQDAKGEWFGGKDIYVDNGVYLKVADVEERFVPEAKCNVAFFTLEAKNGAEGKYGKVTAEKVGDEYIVKADGVEVLRLVRIAGTAKYQVVGSSSVINFASVARFDSEKDLTGKYLGEVEITMKDYHFRPRPISLGVTWTQLTELVLDTSFGISTEEILLDYASQEIKKALDYQSIKYASDVQKTYANDNFVKFDAKYASQGTGAKDSYWHQAQLIGQAIGHVEDNMLNKFGRGGVTAIVGGTDACRYLELNEGWSIKGAQPKIGAHKVGELNGIPVFKVPNGIIPKNQLVTTWKNENAEGDVCIAIGTLVPFLSTGALQRKNLYKEAAIARYEDTQALRPEYLGRIQIDNIQ